MGRAGGGVKERARSQPRRARAIPTKLIERERQAADRALRLFFNLAALASDESAPSDLAEALNDQARTAVVEADPVRLSYAAGKLGISPPTVLDWANRGVLELQESSPRRVSLASVATTLQRIRRLREVGDNRETGRLVLNLLESEAWEDDQRFKRSLRQMERGERRELPY